MLRKIGEFNIFQRTKDGMFNATALIKQWNGQPILHTQKNGYVKKKDLDDYLSNKNTQMFIKTIQERENLNTTKLVYLKSRASRGENAGTWMHPMLFIDFAMWINPSFKYDVLKFVSDQMIRYRNDAGDAYRKLSSSVASIVPKGKMEGSIRKVAETLNWIVFDGHEHLMRNRHGDEAKQRELWELERKVSDLINEGFIDNYRDLIIYLRKKYQEKHTPDAFII